MRNIHQLATLPFSWVLFSQPEMWVLSNLLLKKMHTGFETGMHRYVLLILQYCWLSQICYSHRAPISPAIPLASVLTTGIHLQWMNWVMHNSDFPYVLDCGSRKNRCSTDVNTTDTTIKTISISTWLIVPVQGMHLKVITPQHRPSGELIFLKLTLHPIRKPLSCAFSLCGNKLIFLFLRSCSSSSSFQI